MNPNLQSDSDRSHVSRLSFESTPRKDKIYVVHRMNEQKKFAPVENLPIDSIEFTPKNHRKCLFSQIF